MARDIVPIFGLSAEIHFLLLFIASIGFATLFVILFPRLITPLFLKAKSTMKKGYYDGYISRGTELMSKNRKILRSINVALLCLGLMAFIIPLVDPGLFVSDLQYYIETLGVNPRYVLNVLISILLIIFPIAIGLWSIGWVLEDGGLMHAKFENRPDALYEIEPVYLSYNSYLKGFAGVSTIFFLIQIILEWAKITSEDRSSDIIGTITIPITAILLALLIHKIYEKINKSFEFVQKDLPKFRKLSDSEIKEN